MQLQQTRIERNVQALGVAWGIFGVYRLFAVTFAMHAARHFGWMGHSIHAFGSVSIFFAGLAFLAGYGLLTRQRWARVLAIVLGCLALIHFPLGTALGIYTLWVLKSRAARYEWEQFAAVPGYR